MKKFKVPIYSFDFINGILRINGEIALSKNSPADEVINRVINALHIKPKKQKIDIFIFYINDLVDDYTIELITLKENSSKIEYIVIHYFENNSVSNGISESSLVKKIQKSSCILGQTTERSEISFKFPWGSIIVQHDIKIASSCLILQYKN